MADIPEKAPDSKKDESSENPSEKEVSKQNTDLQKSSKEKSKNVNWLQGSRLYALIAITLILGVVVFYAAYVKFIVNNKSKALNPSSSQNLTTELQIANASIIANASTLIPINYSGPTIVIVEDPANPINVSKFATLITNIENYTGIKFTVTRIFTKDLPGSVIKRLVIIPALVLRVPQSMLQSNYQLVQVVNALPRLSSEEYLVLPYHPLYGYALLPLFYSSINVSFRFLYHANLILIQPESRLARFTRYSDLPRILQLLSYMVASNITLNSTKIVEFNQSYVKAGITLYPALLLQTDVPLKIPGKKIVLDNNSYLYISPASSPALQSMLRIQFIETHYKPVVRAEDPVVGNPNLTPIVIYEYLDLYCPYCAKFANDTFPELYNNYIKQRLASYVVKSFLVHPQAKDVQVHFFCLYNVTRNGTLAIELLENLYKNYYQSLIQNQYNVPSSQELKNLLNNDAIWQRVETCANNSAWDSVFANESMEAENLGISGTPGFVIWSNEKNYGIVFAGAYPYETFKNIIDYLLSQ
jgi:protein-disulfide isomerase